MGLVRYLHPLFSPLLSAFYVIRMYICITNIQAQTTSMELVGIWPPLSFGEYRKECTSIRSALNLLGKSLNFGHTTFLPHRSFHLQLLEKLFLYVGVLGVRTPYNPQVAVSIPEHFLWSTWGAKSPKQLSPDTPLRLIPPSSPKGSVRRPSLNTLSSMVILNRHPMSAGSYPVHRAGGCGGQRTPFIHSL